MRNRVRVGCKAKVLLLVLFIGAKVAYATEYLVWGGGGTVSSSQIVLERNLNLFHSIADSKNIPLDSRKTLFGAGLNSNVLDVVYKDRDLTDDEKVFSTMWRSNPSLAHSNRRNQVKNLNGDASKATFSRVLKDLLLSLGSEKKSRLYYTGHGAGEDPFRSNFFVSWGPERFDVDEFTRILDKSESSASLQVVMTQCFSGGFSQINYEGGVYKGNLSKQNRCGFFSQIPSRVAAGCSADILEREEYTPYFMAAVSGTHEAGYSVNADYNSDGIVSANEAHYYVIATENSLDIPVSTSTEFLRSELGRAPVSLNNSDLKASLRPEESFAFQQLLQLTGLQETEQNLGDVIKSAIAKKQAKHKTLEASAEEKAQKFTIGQSRLLEVLSQVPQGAGPEEYIQIMLTVEGYDQTKLDYLSYVEVNKALHAKVVEIAKLERLQYLVDSKNLEKTLELEGSEEQRQKFKQLKGCEGEAFI